MAKKGKAGLKSLPSVDKVLKLPEAEALIGKYGRTAATQAIRDAISQVRTGLLKGDESAADKCGEKAVIGVAADMADRAIAPRLKRAVNATGIILHTGLGRAKMPEAARQALAGNTGYCNVQMDLDTGERMQRESCLIELVRRLTGAEAALVVNNNAGATMLVLRALAQGREVIVSRGELIEIGGSFRLPEIMAESGAVMREVGATNKTHVRDYENAIGPETALLLKAHKSNYRIEGFTKEVSIADIAKIGKEHGLPVVDDLGCGALVPLENYGLEHEMTMRESLEAGSDVVLSSTDKLIGGPQGGLIIGKGDLLKRIRSNPFYRVLRVGKMTLSALESTLRLFASPEHLNTTHPVYMMLAKTPGDMKPLAEKLAGRISRKRPEWDVAVVEEKSHLGGGSLPGSELPSFAVRIRAPGISPGGLARLLRGAPVPIIPHVREDTVLLNMRTVFEGDLDDIVAGCVDAAEAGAPK